MFAFTGPELSKRAGYLACPFLCLSLGERVSEKDNWLIRYLSTWLLRLFRNRRLAEGILIFIILTTTLVLSSCTPRPVPGPVYLYPKVEPIDIELASYSFYPNHIAVIKNDSTFTIRLKNTDKIKHNFTLIDSQKDILTSIDVMPNKSTAVTIESPDPGNYTFYCKRFPHRFLGMEGMLMVH
jgi:plastocyanin